MARPQEFDSEQALKQAMDLFWENGYEQTSLRDLLKQMNIQRSSFYNTFGDKHSLFIQALDCYMKLANDKFLIEKLNAHESGLEGIHQVFHDLVDIRAADTEYKGCLMVNTQVELARTDDVVRQMINVSVKKIQRAFYAALKRAQVTGEIRAGLDLEATSKFLTNTILSLRMMGRTNNHRQDFEQIAQMTLSILKP